MDPPFSRQFTAQILPSIASIDRSAWDKIFGAASEGFDYYLACEKAPPSMFEFSALGVLDGETLVAGAPAFRTDFRLDMMVEGRSRKLADWVGRRVPGLMNFAVMGVGSPHSDNLSLAIDPALNASQRRRALEVLLDGLERQATLSGIGMTFLKNVSDRDSRWSHDVLQRRGYARVAALPIATLSVPNSEEAYIASLSANMRSNIRRKMKRAKGLRVEVRGCVEGLNEEISALRDATRQRAMTDYDAFAEVSTNYFRQVLSHLGERAKLLLYWKGDALIGFALVLIEPGRLIEKYNGMRYPDGPDHGVFFMNWMTQVRLCVERGIPELHAGETTYLTKARLGCKLHRSWIYFRHHRRPVNGLFGLLSRWIAFDSTDPDLRKLGTEAPYVDS
jgi:predicted N-acyltransferase